MINALPGMIASMAALLLQTGPRNRRVAMKQSGKLQNQMRDALATQDLVGFSNQTEAGDAAERAQKAAIAKSGKAASGKVGEIGRALKVGVAKSGKAAVGKQSFILD
jgi:ATP-dependent protease ClpP protease subunit